MTTALYIVLSLLTAVALVSLLRRTTHRVQNLQPLLATSPPTPTPAPKRVKLPSDNRLRNPYLLTLLPHVEAAVGLAKRALTITEIMPALRRETELPFTRKHVKACLRALTTNHHTVARLETTRSRSGRRGPYRYAPAKAA